jgi:hypothetical protein
MTGETCSHAAMQRLSTTKDLTTNEHQYTQMGLSSLRMSFGGGDLAPLFNPRHPRNLWSKFVFIRVH